MDDESFRIALALNREVSSHPAAAEVYPEIKRALRKPKKKYFAQAFFNSLVRIRPITPTGLLLPETGAFRVDYKAMLRVLERITKGLFFLRTGTSLPDTHFVTIVFPAAIAEMPEQLIDVIKDMLEELLQADRIIVGRNVFSFKVLFNATNPNESVWFFLFYDKIWFLSLTIPRNDSRSFNQPAVAH